MVNIWHENNIFSWKFEYIFTHFPEKKEKRKESRRKRMKKEYTDVTLTIFS